MWNSENMIHPGYMSRLLRVAERNQEDIFFLQSRKGKCYKSTKSHDYCCVLFSVENACEGVWQFHLKQLFMEELLFANSQLKSHHKRRENANKNVVMIIVANINSTIFVPLLFRFICTIYKIYCIPFVTLLLVGAFFALFKLIFSVHIVLMFNWTFSPPS